jgi:hypothetical protein
LTTKGASDNDIATATTIIVAQDPTLSATMFNVMMGPRPSLIGRRSNKTYHRVSTPIGGDVDAIQAMVGDSVGRDFDRGAGWR